MMMIDSTLVNVHFCMIAEYAESLCMKYIIIYFHHTIITRMLSLGPHTEERGWNIEDLFYK